jgi:hypothetical protein
MATFAVIKDGIVDNCIVAESLAIAEEVTGLTCIEYTVPSIGCAYADGKFVSPAVVEVAPTEEQETSNG